MVATLDLDFAPHEHTRFGYPDEAYMEAIEDAKSLQAMVENLLDCVRHSHDEMQRALEVQQDSSLVEKLQWRHIEEIMRSIHSIQRDVDEIVESYRHPPLKSFVRTNSDQLRAIHRLSHLLPSLRPFLSMPAQYPAAIPEYSEYNPLPLETDALNQASPPIPKYVEHHPPPPEIAPCDAGEWEEPTGETNEYEQIAQNEGLDGRWRPRVSGAACLDREPRSLASMSGNGAPRRLKWALPVDSR